MIQISMLVIKGKGCSHIRGRFFFDGPPTSMIAGLSELMLTGNQQMIRQHPNEQMPGSQSLPMMAILAKAFCLLFNPISCKIFSKPSCFHTLSATISAPSERI
jgi:hypothetical protein